MQDVVITKEALKKAYYKRFYAWIVDAVIWLILLFTTIALFGTEPTVVSGASKSSHTVLNGWPAAIFILLEILYPIVLEWQLGATLGKLSQGIRVVDYKGGRITLKQSFVRNFLRIVDAFPYIIPYAVGIFNMADDERCRRVGDKVAGTIVTLTAKEAVNTQEDKSSGWSLPS